MILGKDKEEDVAVEGENRKKKGKQAEALADVRRR